MIDEAEKFADEDRELKEKIDTKNSFESYIYSMRNTIEDKEKLAEKLSEDEKEKISDAIKEAQDWLMENPEAGSEEVREKQKEMEQVCNPIIAKFYQNQGGAAGGDDDDDTDFDDL